ncbi:MAG: hypothetical protein AAF547_10905 [Actinomycetota bacterium]
MASAQLQLITTEASWKLDRHTVEVGRAGIAKARAALAAATELPEGELFPLTRTEEPDHRAAA